MKNTLIKLAKNTLSRFGYEIIPSWRMEQYDFANHLRELFKLLDIKCVIDVGANRGQYRDFLRAHVGYEGLILSFEPVSSLADYLFSKSKSDPFWEVFPFALGSSETTHSINVMTSDQFSSFLTPDHTVVADFTEKNKIDHQEQVLVRKLDILIDDLKKKYSIQNIYLKLDTQGYDLEILKGAENTLCEIMALQSEVSVLRIYAGMPDFLTTIKLLNEKGFDISGMFPVSRDRYLRVVEFDAVMVRRLGDSL